VNAPNRWRADAMQFEPAHYELDAMMGERGDAPTPYVPTLSADEMEVAHHLPACYSEPMNDSNKRM